MPRTNDKDLINAGAKPIRPPKKYSHLIFKRNIQDHREFVQQAIPTIAPADVDRYEEIVDLGGGVKLLARIFTRKGEMQKTLPTAFLFEGTAWVATSLQYGDMIASNIAAQSGHRVILLELLLAPENKVLRITQFAWRFFEYFCRNEARYKINPEKKSIIGYSTGADLAVSVANRASRAGIAIAQKLLISGVYDLSGSVERNTKYRPFNEFANQDPQIPKSFIKFWRKVAVPVIDRRKPSVSSYFQVPHSKTLTRIIFGSTDCVRTENEAECDRLQEHGVDLEKFTVLDGSHGDFWRHLTYIRFVADLLNIPKTGDSHEVKLDLERETYEIISPRQMQH